MPVIIEHDKNRKDGFTYVPNTILNDNRISATAKTYYIQILQHSGIESWNPSVKGYASLNCMKKDIVTPNKLHKRKKSNYVRKTEIKKDNTKHYPITECNASIYELEYYGYLERVKSKNNGKFEVTYILYETPQVKQE